MNPPGTRCFQDIPSSCLLVTDSPSQRSCNMFNMVIFVPSTFIHFNVPQLVPPYAIIKVRLCLPCAYPTLAMRCFCPRSLQTGHKKSPMYLQDVTSWRREEAMIYFSFLLTILCVKNTHTIGTHGVTAHAPLTHHLKPHVQSYAGFCSPNLWAFSSFVQFLHDFTGKQGGRRCSTQPGL